MNQPPAPNPGHRPNLLPEEDARRQTRPVPTIRSRQGYVISLLLTLILLSIAFFGTALIIIYRPGLFDLETRANIAQTEISFQGTREALDGTANALEAIGGDLRATAQHNADSAFNNESTRAALENRQMMLDQAGTQTVLDAQATETAVAIANAQQATRAALDFQATQVEFERAATQAEIAYQGTQAALNRDATAAALGFATSAAPANDVLTQTPPATLTAMPLFTDDFASGARTSIWDFSAVEDWSLADDGTLVADRSGAWMLSQMDTLTGYIIETDLVPLQGSQLAADYHLLLNVQAQPQAPNGYTLRVSYDGSRVTAVGLHAFILQDLFEGDGLLNRPLTTIQSRQVNLPPDAQIRLRLEIREQRIVAVINEQLALDIMLDSLPAPGSVGLQIPAGAGIVRVSLLP